MAEIRDLLQCALREISEKEGIPLMELSDDDSCVLPFGDGLMLYMQYEPAVQALDFLVVLGTVPIECRAAAYGQLLSANLFWGKTYGATLALNPESEEIILQYRHCLRPLNALQLCEVLEGFLHTAEEWRNRLQEVIEDAASLSEDEEEDADDDAEMDGDEILSADDVTNVQNRRIISG